MNYDETRDAEHLGLMEFDIDRFVTQFNPDAPTVFLIIGGMASQLRQATVSFAAQPDPPYLYETEWLSLNIFCGAADSLAMTADLDSDGHITVASGAVGFMGISQYLGFQQWCTLQHTPLNYLVLSWDWRRRAEAYVTLLEETIFPYLAKRIQAAYQANFFETEYYLLSHSFGGLVLKLLLNDCGGQFVRGLRKAITVAAPFYGYGGSQHFYFAGYSYLNHFYSKTRLAKIIGSFAGPYALMFLDQATYDEVNTQLNADTQYPIGDYPSLDAVDPTMRVDPYDPGPNRYPDGGWVNLTELASAAQTRLAIAAPLSPTMSGKLYHIRGIQTENGSPRNNTIVRQTWQTIKPGFNPDTNADPVKAIYGAGDGTIPPWSARLADTPKENIITVTDDVDHVTLMDNPKVLGAIGDLMGIHTTGRVTEAVELVFSRVWKDAASAKMVKEILERARVEALPDRIEFFKTLPRKTVRAIARRIILDLPSPAP